MRGLLRRLPARHSYVPKKKQPFNIDMKDDGLFAFAGLWGRWMSPEKTNDQVGFVQQALRREFFIGGNRREKFSPRQG
jgi:hypothetical protein